MTIRKSIAPGLYNIQDLGTPSDKFERVYVQNLFADNIEVSDQIVDGLTINTLTVNQLIDGNQTPTIFDIIANKAHKFDVAKNIVLQGAITADITTDFADNQIVIDTYINSQTLTASIGQLLNQDLITLSKYNNLITNLGFQQLQNLNSSLTLNLQNASNNTLGKIIYDNQQGLLNKVNTTLIGAPNGVASLDELGKIPESQIPAIAITDTFTVVDNTERDALEDIQQGDFAIVTNDNKSYVWSGTNWIEIKSGTNADLNLSANQIIHTTSGQNFAGSNSFVFKNYSGTGLSDKTLVIGGDPNYNTTIKTSIVTADSYNGTYSGLTMQNKSSGSSASVNLYLKNEGNSEISDYSVLGLGGKAYNSGSDYLSEKAKTLYLGNSNGDITIMPNFLADVGGGSVHLTYENGVKAISVTNSGALSTQTTFDINTQEYQYQTGNSGDILISGGSNANVSWTSRDTLLSEINWIYQTFAFNNIQLENGVQYITVTNSIKKLNNIPQLKVVLNGIELNDTEYSVPVLPANRINFDLVEGDIESGDIIKVWYIKNN
jgi:hypothetical protein